MKTYARELTLFFTLLLAKLGLGLATPVGNLGWQTRILGLPLG